MLLPSLALARQKAHEFHSCGSFDCVPFSHFAQDDNSLGCGSHPVADCATGWRTRFIGCPSRISAASKAALILDDFGEGLRVEAGSAYEGAIDFRLVEQRDGVVGLDAASVEDADAVSDVAAETAGDLAADEQVG